jgi:hypothetical protein
MMPRAHQVASALSREERMDPGDSGNVDSSTYTRAGGLKIYRSLSTVPEE